MAILSNYIYIAWTNTREVLWEGYIPLFLGNYLYIMYLLLEVCFIFLGRMHPTFPWKLFIYNLLIALTMWGRSFGYDVAIFPLQIVYIYNILFANSRSVILLGGHTSHLMLLHIYLISRLLAMVEKCNLEGTPTFIRCLMYIMFSVY